MVTSVEAATRPRVPADTRRGVGIAIVVASLLLHLPLTPLGQLLGLAVLLNAPDASGPTDINALTAIPIDMVPARGPRSGESAPAAERADDADEDEPEELEDDDLDDLDDDPGDLDDLDDLDFDEEPDESTVRPPDAGAAPSSDAGVDAGAPDGGKDAGGEPDAGKARPRAARGPIDDPVAISGTAATAVDSNANVRLVIYTDRIRGHPISERLGAILSRTDQWKDFFGPTGLDPVRDIDRILIAGPQLKDSRHVVAVLRYNVGAAKVRKAIEALVERSKPKGEWLKDAPVPAARSHTARADRLLVMAAPNIVVIAPPEAKNALELPRDLKFSAPKGREAMITYVRTPWRVFIGMRYSVPKSIKWVRLKIVAEPDGGVSADLLAEDESAEAAKASADYLTQSINALTLVKVNVFGMLKRDLRIIDPVTFRADGKLIKAHVRASPKQLKAVMEAIAGLAEEFQREQRKKAEARKEKRKTAAKNAPKPGAPKQPGAPKPAPKPAQKGE